MNSHDDADLEFDATTFSGVARLFPLPNLVLFPHVMQPLHIFEQRYRDMLEDALAGDQLIAMARLAPEWEASYEGRPPVSKYACLGKIVCQHRLDDGRYNLLLLGVQRVRIRHELAPLRSFRQAEVEVIDDCYDCASCHELKSLRQTLLASFRQRLGCMCDAPDQLQEILAQHLSLGAITDLAAYALPIDLEIKQQLLEERRVVRRAQILLAELNQLSPGSAKGVLPFKTLQRFSDN